MTVLDLPLRAPANRVSPRAKPFWTVGAAITVTVLLLPQLITYLVVGLALLGVTSVITAILGLAYVLVMPQVRYRVHRWEVTDTAVYTLTGWLSRHWRIAPISRIQTVDTERGPLQQLFRLATVTVTTASARGPVLIAQLDADEAAELAGLLTERAHATPGDAT